MCYSCEQMEAGAAILDGEMERMEIELHSEIWTMRDGKTIKVRHMTEQHIRNTINMLRKSNHPMASGWIDVFNEELEGRKNVTQ